MMVEYLRHLGVAARKPRHGNARGVDEMVAAHVPEDRGKTIKLNGKEPVARCLECDRELRCEFVSVSVGSRLGPIVTANWGGREVVLVAAEYYSGRAPGEAL